MGFWLMAHGSSGGPSNRGFLKGALKFYAIQFMQSLPFFYHAFTVHSTAWSVHDSLSPYPMLF